MDNPLPMPFLSDEEFNLAVREARDICNPNRICTKEQAKELLESLRATYQLKDWNTKAIVRDTLYSLNNYYDYNVQAWVVDGKYIRCGHKQHCQCYGRLHAGESANIYNGL